MSRALFLTWVPHRRTREIARLLGMPVVELASRHRGLRRYAELAWRTLGILRREKPRVLLVQSPSLVLVLFVLLVKPFHGFRVVVDAHNESVAPFLHSSRLMRALTRWQLRAADLVIVTNEELAAQVIAARGKPAVLTDAVPDAPRFERIALAGAFRVAIISSFAPDEPIEAILEAARRCGDEIHFYMTGNPARLEEGLRARVPPNLTLTGYLSEERYWSTLGSCEAILDLTLMPDCLVCGAYEAIALGKPLILSDNRASFATFAGFGLFTDGDPERIASTIKQMRTGVTEFERDLPAQRARFIDRWRNQASVVEGAIARLASQVM